MSDSSLRILGRALRILPDLVRSGPDRRFTAADLLERQARRRPDAPFVRFEGRTVSYRELNAQANQIAHWALAHGLGQGGRRSRPTRSEAEPSEGRSPSASASFAQRAEGERRPSGGRARRSG